MRKWYPWLLVGLALGFSAAVYSKLPAEIPSHWDAEGQVNGTLSRAWGVWLMPAVLLAMAIVLPRLPDIDPRRENYDKFRPSYDLVMDAIMTLLAVMHVAMLGIAIGWPIRMERLAPVLVGMMFVVIGNVMPRARSNWLFGIRTPWTLTNDRVWARTHRLGGLLFVVAGILLAVAGVLIPTAFVPIITIGIVIAAVVPVIYSYFAWRQESSRAHTS